jgi:hypothetical protein
MADYAIMLSWIGQELQDIELRRPEHHPLIVRLQSELADTKDLHEPVVALARDMWEGYEGTRKRDESFELVCSESLLDCLVDASICCIGELLPNAQYYSTTLPCDEELECITEEMSLEEMLNRGTKILFTYPERYANWEEKIFEQLKAISDL